PSTGYGQYDPYARSEDLGDDPVKSSDYGIANLKYILANTNSWLADQDPDYTHRRELYSQIASQYLRYMNHVLAQVGGIELYFPGPKSKHLPAEPVSKQIQRAALKWTVNELRNMDWLSDKSLTTHFNLASPIVNTIAVNVSSDFISEIPDKVMLCSTLSDDPYTLKQYFDDLYNLVFAPAGKLSPVMKTIQREIVSSTVKPVKKAQNASLSEDEIGESRSPYQSKITSPSYDETSSYYGYLVTRIQALAKARRNSAAPEDRAHYDYLYRMTTAVDPE
nr:zinc-dependent metalloprotease [Bacteroidales bacterium]